MVGKVQIEGGMVAAGGRKKSKEEKPSHPRATGITNTSSFSRVIVRVPVHAHRSQRGHFRE